MPLVSDILIVGAGAAGLATAIFAARERPDASILLVDGARTLGAKILVSGGGRCNVTNVAVAAADFNGGSPAAIARTLRALPVPDTVAFFAELGVTLHEEPLGKLFPDSNRARTVLDALVTEARTRGVTIRTAHRVAGVSRTAEGFLVSSPAGDILTRRLALTTGGRSLPKSGSDGAGYDLARELGHSMIETTPGLVPLVLEGELHRRLSGVSVPVELTLHGADSAAPSTHGAGRAAPSGALDLEGEPTPGASATSPSRWGVRRRICGSLLFTHFGISGPAALDMSRHWLRARLEGRATALTASVIPDLDFEQADAALRALTVAHPRTPVVRAIARLPAADGLPASVASMIAVTAGVPADRTLAALTKAERRAVVHALTARPMDVVDSRGYNHAEVTAGGITLAEVDPATMASRVCPGLFLAGEILDVDGRLGGFNFQWAWASARAAALGVTRSLA